MAQIHMRVQGKVIAGKGIAGAELGYPTANLILERPLNIENGVYAGRTTIDDVDYVGAICYGVEPGKFEIHLFDFSGDLLDRELSVTIEDKVSNLVLWESAEQMRAKIAEDIKRIRELTSDVSYPH